MTKLFLAALMLASVSLVSAQASDTVPEGKPTFSGTFTVSYSPIMCIRAPCPPGAYSIMVQHKRIGWVRTVVIKSATGETSYKGRYIGHGRNTIEGSVWIDGQTAIIRASQITPGKSTP